MSWIESARRLIKGAPATDRSGKPSIALALGGGFARGIAHVGVLRVLEANSIPIHMIGGVSAGAMVAAAYASGTPVGAIEEIARGMRFRDVARWTISRMGLAGSERMQQFLRKLLHTYRFEDMRIPLAVVATNLCSGAPVVFKGSGDAIAAIRASCSYPGLFLPMRYNGQWLVDGAISMEVPASPVRQMGATHVISVALPVRCPAVDPTSMFGVVNRCFQIMSSRTEREWRRNSSAVIEPDASGIEWNGFESCTGLVEAGEKATRAILPKILSWLGREQPLTLAVPSCSTSCPTAS
jgi:NTE family protein